MVGGERTSTMVEELPLDVLGAVLARLDPLPSRDRLQAMSVCRKWRLAGEIEPALWLQADFSKHPNVNDQDVIRIVKLSQGKMRTCSFEGCHLVTDAAVNALQGCPALDELHAGSKSITAPAVLHLLAALRLAKAATQSRFLKQEEEFTDDGFPSEQLAAEVDSQVNERAREDSAEACCQSGDGSQDSILVEGGSEEVPSADQEVQRQGQLSRSNSLRFEPGSIVLARLASASSERSSDGGEVAASGPHEEHAAAPAGVPSEERAPGPRRRRLAPQFALRKLWLAGCSGLRSYEWEIIAPLVAWLDVSVCTRCAAVTGTQGCDGCAGQYCTGCRSSGVCALCQQTSCRQPPCMRIERCSHCSTLFCATCRVVRDCEACAKPFCEAHLHHRRYFGVNVHYCQECTDGRRIDHPFWSFIGCV